MEDEIWIQIKSGNKKAFRTLFDQYYYSLCLYANSILKDADLSQDVVSDSFIRIWEKRENIHIESTIKNYLLLTVRNAVYSYLRSPESRKVDLNTVIENIENIPINNYDLEKDETILRVKKLIEELPDQRKKIFELATVGGKTYKEIAHLLGISVNTVNTQMSRAYRFLRDQLGSESLLLWILFTKN
ncbi:RNA polymerase sigma-70 factor [Maribellus comscasis]|uniref:RNA polymerase sigma-70 factor n=1 Tax=Maribellus comscasis TaxID=2681766 RepID=A0A6I6K154_9BACT|nr:RNA polymerase sigma-70 factor [Maribellus comscasis]QGY47180.1 RNA polymerase sigma-70 factor [Maribellus comscasis]